jgi:hypothetical protein
LAIETKQEGIKELSEKPNWRQNFSTIASLVKVEHPASEIIDWIHNYKLVFPTSFRYLPAVFSVLSLLLIVALGLQLIPELVL